jgi:hypothetical protein
MKARKGSSAIPSAWAAIRFACACIQRE